jgi:hypothetical protein
MDQGPRTFRDPFLSLFQSAAAEVARRRAGAAATGALEDAGDSEEVAAADVAAARFANAKRRAEGIEPEPDESTALEEVGIGENAKICAKLALQLAWARLRGDTVMAAQIEHEDLPKGKCDASWASTVKEYFKYFGVDGQQGAIPYIKPSDVGAKVITIKSNARIGLVGDWGTGAAPAIRVLRQLKAQSPDVLIHLGDIYYSGTDSECHANFEAIVDAVLERKNGKLPVYTLAGNHDMYSGGLGYYALLKRLNQPPLTQPASFFCLRAEDNSWQLLAMDTGRFDFNPITVAHALTHVDPAELDWHEQRIKEFPGKTILLSHHQLFSAYSQIGEAQANGRFPAYNGELKKALDRLQAAGRIPAWFWGHEHNFCIYQPYLGLQRGRCLGHSAIPVFIEDEPYQLLKEIDDPPQIVAGTQLSTADGFYRHGFAVLTLAGTSAPADYFEDRSGTATKMYSEVIV